MLRDPGSRLFGSEIVGRHADPFIVAYQFENPRGWSLFTQPATDYLGAAVAGVTGDGIRALNIVVLASFPLAALLAYLLAFRLAASRPAAWLAGLLYGFAPFHVAQSAYHAHGSQTQWLPLYLLALWLCFERWSLPRALLLALATALVVLSSYYYGLIAAVVTPFVLLGLCLGRALERRPWARNLATTLATLAALGIAAVTHLALTAPTVLVNPSALGFPREDLLLYGARWWSYLVPPVEHPLFGSWTRDLWAGQALDGLLEQQVTVGAGLLLLSTVALVEYLRGSRATGLAAAPALVLAAGGAFWFSLAPSANEGWSSLLAPSALIYEVLPMFRAYARFGLVVFLALAILGAIGAARLARSRSPAARLSATALVAFTLLELTPLPPFRWREVLPTSAHRWLAHQTEPVRALDCVPSGSGAELTFFLRFAPDISTPTGIEDCADPGFIAGLAQRGFSHLLVRRPSPFGHWLSGHASPEGLTAVGTFDDAFLFAVDDRPGLRLLTSLSDGFHWREYKGDRTYRWMSQHGSLTVTNTTTETLSVELELELHGFAEPRTLDVSLDRNPIAVIEVGTALGTHSIGPFELAPAAHVIELSARQPATVADEVLGNLDRRALTVALWDLHWSFDTDRE
ncbi:MAG: hypothetical protein GY769_03900 [bacterium]|nr:hypothetical protein [bacterium]